MSNLREHFGEVLSEYMRQKERTPGKLSNLTGIPKQTIVAWQQGRVAKPRDVQDIFKLGEALDLDIAATNRLLIATGYTESLISPDVAPTTSSNPAQALEEFSLPHHLPTQLMPMIGREEELREIFYYLLEPTCRLLTLTGIGGAGKTRLAVAAAEKLATAGRTPFQDGIWFVPLAEVRPDSDGRITALVAAIAEILQLSSTLDPEQRLLDYLAPKHLLLVLDNFEHLLKGRSFIVGLLKAAPHIKVLVTSREPLQLTVEELVHLGGLTVPDNEDVSNPARFSSVHLFMEQARRKNKNFAPDVVERKAIVRLCQLVQGLPLAILQAASWSNDFKCIDILAAVQGNLDFLTVNAPDLPEQHRSMRSVFNYSWSLLSTHEQQVLTQLTVFRGAFNRTAALTITKAKLSDIVALTNKSLLEQPAPGIYQMHELLRQFVEQLTDIQKQQQYFRRHAEYYLDLIRSYEGALCSSAVSVAANEIKLALDNIRQAWDWTLSQSAIESKFLIKFVDSSWALMLFFDLIGALWEGEQRFSQAVTTLSATREESIAELSAIRSLLQCQLQAQYAHFLVALGFYNQGIGMAQEAIESARKTSHLRSQVLAYLVYGRALASQGLYQEAFDKFETGLAIAHNTSFYHETIFLLIEIGIIQINHSNYSDAQNHFSRALQLARQVGDYHGESSGLGNLGRVSLNKGEYTIAKDYFRQEALHAQKVDVRNKARSLAALGWLAHREGSHIEALQYYKESLPLARKMGRLSEITRALRGLAWAAYLEKDYDAADAYFEESLQITRKAGHQRDKAVTLNNWGLVTDLQGEHILARYRFNESLDIFRKLGNRQSTANTLVNLAFNLLATGEIATAKQNLCEALEIAYEIGAKAIITEAVAGYAHMHLMLKNVEWSVKLLAIVLADPTTPFDIIETRLNPLKHELEKILSIEQLQIRLAHEEQVSLITIIEIFLAER